MNTTVTRPGHMLPNWSLAYMRDQDATASMVEGFEREARAGRRLTFAAGVFLALSLASGVLASGLTVKGWQDATALHVIETASAPQHVL